MAIENPNNLDLNLDGQGQQGLDLNFDQSLGVDAANGAGGLTLSLDLLEMHATPANASPDPMEALPSPALQPMEGRPNPQAMKPLGAPRLPEINPPSISPNSTYFPSEPATNTSATTGAFPTFPSVQSAGGWSVLDNKQVGGVTKANRFDFSNLKAQIDRISRPQQFILVLLITMAGGYFFLDTENDFLSEFSLPSFENLFGSGEEAVEDQLPEGAPNVSQVEAKVAEKRKEKTKIATNNQPAANTQDASIWQENPYWALTNGLDGELKQINESWTPEQEQGWRTAITSAELWPKYRTLFQVRTLNLSGSQLILKELALSEKFWLRMMALMALADFGDPIPFGSVEIAIGDAHSELFARFVSRFEDESTPGERYILRESIRIADARGRIAILRAITANPDKYTPLYLVAGTFDPNPKVQRFASLIVRQKKLEHIYDLQDIVRGVKSFEDYAEARRTAMMPAEPQGAAGSGQVGASPESPSAASPEGAQKEATSAAEISKAVENGAQKTEQAIQTAEQDGAAVPATQTTGGEAAPLRERSGASADESQPE